MTHEARAMAGGAAEHGWSARVPVVALVAATLALIAIAVAVAVATYAASSEQSEWELDRPLASLELDITVAREDDHERWLVGHIDLRNQGGRTFVIRDVVLELELEGGVEIAWEDSSLRVEHTPSLPLGMDAFTPKIDGRRGSYRLNHGRASWHVVDPHRSVSIPFLVPVSGAGTVCGRVTTHLQQVYFESVQDMVADQVEITTFTYDSVPEFGVDDPRHPEDAVSTEPIFPYSASAALVVPANDVAAPPRAPR